MKIPIHEDKLGMAITYLTAELNDPDSAHKILTQLGMSETRAIEIASLRTPMTYGEFVRLESLMRNPILSPELIAAFLEDELMFE